MVINFFDFFYEKTKRTKRGYLKNETSESNKIYKQSIDLDVCTYISIELPYKAREVAMLEECWKDITSKLRRLPHHKRRSFIVPRYHTIGYRILNQHVCLQQEG